MILNVSGRTDIVAFYTKWFMNRYRQGFVDVRNPFYPKNVSRIYFSDVDAILFCTKNPIPIVKYLKEIDKPIIFHITITPYKNDIEVNVKNKIKIINAVKEISKILGKDNVCVRYDPILINNIYNLEYHKKAFNRLVTLLDGYINTVIVSFIDDYKNVQKHMSELKLIPFNTDIYREIGTYFSKVAKEHNMSVQTCFEENNLCEYGFAKGECMSKEKAFELTGKTFKPWKARKGCYCECVEMVDIGVYNSCKHLCKYCYANYDEDKIGENVLMHDDKSSLLIGGLNEDDIIKVRKNK